MVLPNPRWAAEGGIRNARKDAFQPSGPGEIPERGATGVDENRL